MFEQAFKNIDDVLWKEAGCSSELDYVEQSSWLLFLKYLDGLEQDRADEAACNGKKYGYILDKPYRWESWAAPKDRDDKLDHVTAMTGDDLRDFVNQKLFPYLHGFTQKASGPNTIEYKIGQIFGEIKNKISRAIIFGTLLTILMSFNSAPRKRSMNCPTCMKPKSRTWAMPAETVENITHPVPSFVPLFRWSSPR